MTTKHGGVPFSFLLVWTTLLFSLDIFHLLFSAYMAGFLRGLGIRYGVLAIALVPHVQVLVFFL